jgi:hypothetical protein
MDRPTVADLQNPLRFRRLERLEFSDLLPFVVEYYLRRRNWVVWSNYLLILANLLVLLWIGVIRHLDFRAWMTQLGWSALAMLLLIPIHELLHALVYRLIGARDIRFGLLLRQGAVYAVAHEHVVGARDFTWLALAPFLGVNGACLLAAMLFPAQAFFALLLSLTHLSAVGGDWAMLSFLWEHRAAPVYTYDDANLKVTFFYQSNRVQP